MEGQIDKKILTLALQDDTSAEKQIASRQLTVKNEKSSSWFIYAGMILLKYYLGDIHEHLENSVNKIVNKYWQ